jgi:hypothetical protein
MASVLLVGALCKQVRHSNVTVLHLQKKSKTQGVTSLGTGYIVP